MSEENLSREQDQMSGSAPESMPGAAAAASVENEPVTEPEKAPDPTWKKALKFILKFGVSAGILTYIICTRDIKWEDFRLVNPWCIAAAFLCV